MLKIIAACVGYVDATASPQAQKLYVASQDFTTSADDDPANEWFQGRLLPSISYNWTVAPQWSGQAATTSVGTIQIANHDGALDAAAAWQFRDQMVVIKALDPGQQWSAGTVLATATIESSSVTDLGAIALTLRDPSAILERALQTQENTGPEAANQLTPYGFGYPRNCSPLLVDTLTYEITPDDYNTLADVKINGASVAYTANTKGFTLSSTPSGNLTCDPVYGGTSADNVLIQESPIQANDLSFPTDTQTQWLDKYSALESPQQTRWYNAPVDNGKAVSAGGKYYFEASVSAGKQGAIVSDGFSATRPQFGVGLTTANPSRRSPPNQAGQYTAVLTEEGGDVKHWTTYRDATLVDDKVDAGLFAGDWNSGDRLAVLCDFDAMEVEFQWLQASDSYSPAEWTSTALSISSNSPLDTLHPMLINCILDSGETGSRIAEIFLEEADFAGDIPTGYEAWGASRFDADTSFDSFVTSLTDQIPGLSVDATTRTTINALGYGYSYYVRSSETAAQILSQAMAGLSGWTFVDRSGDLTFGRLEAPSTSGAMTIDESSVIAVSSLKLDRAKRLSNRMGAARNFTQISLGSADDTITDTARTEQARRYQIEVTGANAMSDTYTHAELANPLETLFIDEADAQAEIDRLTALYAQDRYFVVLNAAMDLADVVAIEPGDDVVLDLGRFGFNNTKAWKVLGISTQFDSPAVRLTLWG